MDGGIKSWTPGYVLQMLDLFYWQGYSDAEIAKRLGKSRGAVAMTLNRARARLRELMPAR